MGGADSDLGGGVTYRHEEEQAKEVVLSTFHEYMIGVRGDAVWTHFYTKLNDLEGKKPSFRVWHHMWAVEVYGPSHSGHLGALYTGQKPLKVLWRWNDATLRFDPERIRRDCLELIPVELRILKAT